METAPASGSGTASETMSAGTSMPDSGPMLSGGTMTSTGGSTTMGGGATTGTGGATTMGVSGGMQPDVGTCMPGDPNCKVCEPAFTDFQDFSYKCSWNPKNYMDETPLVADLENDGTVEIVAYVSGHRNSPDFEDGKLVVIRASDCTEVFRSQVSMMANGSYMAVADLDGDSDLEIIGLRRDPLDVLARTTHEVIVTDHQGNVLAVSPPASVVGGTKRGAIAVADLDGQSPPEIVYAGMALRFENGGLTTVWSKDSVEASPNGIFSVVADVDLDGVPEVVTGNRIFDGLTGEEETPPNVLWFEAGYVAVADLDPSTPEPEVVLVSPIPELPPMLRVFHPVTGDVLIGPLTFGYQYGGPPTIADFDGDGRPEIGVAGGAGYFVFDLECDPNNLPPFCAEPWLRLVIDEAMGTTELQPAFDFDGDGRAEIVYSNHYDKVQIRDGLTGEVLAGVTMTTDDAPVVADVDLDGHAEIVATSHPMDGWLAPPGIYVFEDPEDRWMPARAIWNQRTYHVTNVNPDGSIPEVETNNWTVWNNYYQQVGPEDKPCIPMP